MKIFINYNYTKIIKFIKEKPNTNIDIIKKSLPKIKNVENIIENLFKEGYIKGCIIVPPIAKLQHASNISITEKGEEVLTSKISWLVNIINKIEELFKKTYKAVIFILAVCALICTIIVGIIEINNLPSYDIYNTKEVKITYFDISREIYNNYPFCKDRTVFAYTKTEEDAFISIDLIASTNDMKKFDKARQSEIKNYIYDFIYLIENPYKRDILLIISNEKVKAEETIIYTAHLSWDKNYNIFILTSLKRNIKYDKPLA